MNMTYEGERIRHTHLGSVGLCPLENLCPLLPPLSTWRRSLSPPKCTCGPLRQARRSVRCLWMILRRRKNGSGKIICTTYQWSVGVSSTPLGTRDPPPSWRSFQSSPYGSGYGHRRSVVHLGIILQRKNGTDKVKNVAFTNQGIVEFASPLLSLQSSPNCSGWSVGKMKGITSRLLSIKNALLPLGIPL